MRRQDQHDLASFLVDGCSVFRGRVWTCEPGTVGRRRGGEEKGFVWGVEADYQFVKGYCFNKGSEVYLGSSCH